MLRRIIGEQIELRTALAEDLGRVRADPGQIEQVLMNLVVNARDAMPRGGRLLVATSNVTLGDDHARAHPGAKAGRYALLAVSDEGEGMSEEVRARIFEPFFTTKPEGKGTGLGLSTVYGIVEQSQGHVDLESEVGRGTTFKVYLPRVEAEAEAAATSLPEDPAAGAASGIILLVEDEDALRLLVREVLEAAGYSILEAEDPERALAASRSHVGPIDLVLTDLVMPGLGGRELVERLREGRPGLRALFMSGYTDPAAHQTEGLETGTTFLPKPFAPTVLLRAVRLALTRPASGPGREGG
jgi:CheY-like chemotaxis protein